MIDVIGFGAGGHSRVIAEFLLQDPTYRLVGFLDPDPALWSSDIFGIPVLGGDELAAQCYADGVRHAFLGVGSVGGGALRQTLFDQMRRIGFSVIDARHPQAIISPSAVYGEGLTVMAGAIINSGAQLGDNVLVNTGAIIEHDCRIESHVHVATGAKLAGGVHVGLGAHIGIGACVRQSLQIGRCAVVGAGAVVVKDVPEGVVVAGVPARILKEGFYG